MSGKKKTFILKVLPILAIGVVMLIPAIYACIFLGSMWDPYGKMEDLPVAVVNYDKPVEYNDKTLSIGDDLVEKLKDNKSLKFNFVDKAVAQQGLENGTYYMVITIPENFSDNATTVMSDHPKKLVLNYKTNPGKNYIASKMSATAIEKLSKSIEDTVTETYTQTVFDSIGETADSLYKASDGTKKIVDGSATLKKGNTLITDNLQALSVATYTFKNGAVKLNKGIKSYTEGVDSANNGAYLLNDGLTVLKLKTPELAKGTASLSKGAKALSKGVNTYTKGVDTANKGADTLSKNSKSVTSGAEQLDTAVNTVYTGTGTLKSGLDTMSESLGKTVTEENKNNLTLLTNGLTSLNDGIGKLNQSLQNSTESSLETHLTNTGGDLKAIATSLENAGAGLTHLQQEIQEISQSEWFKSLDTATQQTVISGLSTSAKEIANGLTAVKSNTESAGANLNNAAAAGTEISQAVNSVKTSVKTISESSQKLLPTASTQLTSLYGGLTTVKTNIDEKLITGAESLCGGMAQLAQGTADFKSGLGEYTSGVDTLAKGTKELNKNSSGLRNGSNELAKGAKKLEDSTPALSKGVEDLATGSEKLANGTQKLADNSKALTDGSKSLSDGADKISNGSTQLYTGSLKLNDGLSTLSTGSQALYTGLKDGADTARNTTISKQSKEMFASPVEAKETQQTTVENNGSAMAAYMMCAGLWVAGLAFCVVTGAENDPLRIKKKRRLWLRKLFELIIFSVGSGAILVTLLMAINDLNPLYIGKTFLLAVMTSMTFACIIYFFNILLGKIGSFFLVVLLVIQLACAGGTYPLALSPDIYAELSPYLPFSHAVDGFRMTIATGQDITPTITYLGIYILVFGALSIITTVIKIKSSKTKEYGLARLLEEAFA